MWRLYNDDMVGANLMEELIERLGHLHRMHLHKFAYSSGLNLRQLESLIYLARCNRYSDTPAALTDYLGLTKGTVSQTIIALEKKRLIKKSSDRDDGRVQHLRLTKKGKLVVDRCTEASFIGHAIRTSKSFDNRIIQSMLHLIESIQVAHNLRNFSTCKTCDYFRKNTPGRESWCALTGETLPEVESVKICREHINALNPQS